MTCRICYDEGELISPCKCTAPVHEACLEKWLRISGRRSCEICLHPFEEEDVSEDVYSGDDANILSVIFCVGLVLAFGCAQFGILIVFPMFTNYILLISNGCQLLFYCVCSAIGEDCMYCLIVMKLSSMFSFVLHDFVLHTRSVGFYVEMVSCLCCIIPWLYYFRSSGRVHAYLQ